MRFAAALTLLLVLWMNAPGLAWDFSVAGKDMNIVYYLGFNPATKTLGIQLRCDKEFAVAAKTNNGTWPMSPTLEKAPIKVNVNWYYKGPEPQSWAMYMPNLPVTDSFDLAYPYPDGGYYSKGADLKASDFPVDGSWTFKACTDVFPNNCAFLNIVVAGSKPTPTVKKSDQKPGNVVAKPAPGILAALAKPHLAVVGVKANIDSACTYLFIASVSIKNSGGPLAAGKGTVNVELGKVSGATALPAFGQGETKMIKVFVGTSKDFASHQMGTYGPDALLKPQTEGGQSSFVTSAPFRYGFQVTFPKGYCLTRKP